MVTTITIQKTDNDGYILTYPHPSMEGTAVECFSPTESFSSDDIRKSECECAVTLLWTLLEALGVHNSKHEPYNISITVEDNRENR